MALDLKEDWKWLNNMKKLTRILLAILLTVCVFSGISFHHGHEHIHVHAYEIGDIINVTCPECGCTTAVFDDPMMEPTCTEDGLAWVYCTENEHGWEMTLPALGHDYQYSEEFSIEPTCTDSGVAGYVCSRCGEMTRETVSALGHNYTSTVTKQPTCTEAGLRTYSCTRCSNSYTASIAATGHDYASVVTKEARRPDRRHHELHSGLPQQRGLRRPDAPGRDGIRRGV